jgi:serine protease Do
MTSRVTRTSVFSTLGVALLLSAAFWTQRGLSSPAVAQSQQQDVPGLEHALRLSDAFRHVSKQSMPAVVSITTTGRTVRETVNRRNPLGDDEAFRRFFGNHPQFREFQKNGPNERERRLPGGKGSGFIISPDGVVMTNTHVVRDAEEVVVRLSDGREFMATDIQMDESSDVAIVRIDVDEQLPFLVAGDDTQMEIGDWVLAFGSPFGLHRTVTQGIISAKSRGLQQGKTHHDFLQTDAAINPGNSGGPLVNLRGEVIGINTAISTASGGYDGVGFAIPITAAQWVAEQLMETGSVERAYLGILMQPINAELAEHLDLPTPGGIVVTEVISGSPAEQGGFQVGDILLAVDGKTISNNRHLIGIVERLRVGNSYPVRVMRNNKEVELSITVASRPKDLASTARRVETPTESDGAGEFNVLGLTAQNVTAELADQLGVSISGVVVTSVQRDSGAEKAGLEPGMVISRIGSIEVSTVDDLEQAVQRMDDADKVLLLVGIPSRDGRMLSRFVLIELPQAD